MVNGWFDCLFQREGKTRGTATAPYMCIYTVLVVSPVRCRYNQPFSSYEPLWEKRTKMTQDDIEHYKVKGNRYVKLLWCNICVTFQLPYMYHYHQEDRQGLWTS